MRDFALNCTNKLEFKAVFESSLPFNVLTMPLITLVHMTHFVYQDIWSRRPLIYDNQNWQMRVQSLHFSMVCTKYDVFRPFVGKEPY